MLAAEMDSELPVGRPRSLFANDLHRVAGIASDRIRAHYIPHPFQQIEAVAT